MSGTSRDPLVEAARRAKISAAFKGRPRSPETLAKISAALKASPKAAAQRAAWLGKLHAANTRHGHTRQIWSHQSSPTYRSWKSMWARCTNRRHQAFEHYGGRGITVCARWTRFDHFLADLGERPPGTTLDRIDNDGPYAPENCRWSTPSEQNRNRRRRA